MSETAEMLFFYLDKYGRGVKWRENWWRMEMEQFNQEQLYGVVIQTMTAASQLPMVKVNREGILKTRFKDSPYLDKIIADGPTAVFTTKALRKEAEKIINDMTMKTSLISFAAGLPGNPFTAVAAGTADIVQYFGFPLNLS